MEKSKGKVFVSGAHGFLAWHLINQLLENGYQVKGLTRRSGKIEIDYTESLEIVLGDMNDTEQMRQCTSDCDFMVHCAATTDMSLLNINDYYSPNVASTLSLLQAAVSNKIKKFIYIGTANSFASGTSSRLGNELSSIQSPFHKSGYALSKTKAMHLVLSYADQLHVNVLAPSFMLGAKANKNGSGQIINRALGKKLIFHPPGGKNFVHVKDVAKGVIACIESGMNGTSYLIVNENLSYNDFYNKFNQIHGRKAILVEIPAVFLYLSGLLGDMIRFFGVKSSLSLANMKILCFQAFYSNKKSISELGLAYHDINGAIADTLSHWSA